MGFNTTLVSPNDGPKAVKDLLDPKWKGKMSIAGTSTGVRWIGSTIEVMGREFLDKLAEQDIKVQDMSGAALAGLVASGEVVVAARVEQYRMVSCARLDSFCIAVSSLPASGIIGNSF